MLTAALLATALTAICAGIGGLPGSVALIAVGLCNSIMYPTIYVLAFTARVDRATPAATLLCMTVIGGAVITALCGKVADRAGLGPSLMVASLCYLVVAAFALSCSGKDKKEA